MQTIASANQSASDRPTFISADLIRVTWDAEPRVSDTRLAAVLGFDRPRVIRELIGRHRAELEAYGNLRRGYDGAVGYGANVTVAKTPLADWMKATGHTDQSLALKIAVSDHTVQAWRNRHRHPRPQQRDRIAKIAGPDVAEWLRRPDPIPTKKYLLNEGQALVVCALSRTAQAATVRRALIEVFMAWRRGALTPRSPMPTIVDRRTNNRVRYAKMRLAEAVGALIDLGIEVEKIDLKVIANFYTSLSR